MYSPEYTSMPTRGSLKTTKSVQTNGILNGASSFNLITLAPHSEKNNAFQI
jgi:hypothetical protein